MPEVRVLRRRQTQDPRDPAAGKPVLAVTYSTRTVPPRTVMVEGASPSEDAIRDAIRGDLASLEERKPETFEV